MCLQMLNRTHLASGLTKGVLSSGYILIWSLITNTQSGILVGHTGSVNVLELLSNGLLSSGSDDKTVKIWNLTSMSLEQDFQAFSNIVYCLKQISDSSLVIGGSDQSIYFYNVSEPPYQASLITRFVGYLGSSEPCHAFLYYDNRVLATADNLKYIYLLQVTESSNITNVLPTLVHSTNNILCMEQLSKIIFFCFVSKCKNNKLNLQIFIRLENTKQTTKATTSTTSYVTESSTITSTVGVTSNTAINITSFGPSTYPTLFQTTFSFSNVSLTTWLSIINSDYDVLSCIVNCSNNGLCKYGGNSTFICACNQNFTGSTCDQSLLPCSYHPCVNNGECYDYSTDPLLLAANNITFISSVNSSYICKCANYYYGTKCESKINMCANVTCSFNGICYEKNNTAVCRCFQQYSGAYCEIISSQQKTIKNVASFTTNFAIAIILVFFALVFLTDLIDFFCGMNAYQKKKPSVIKKVVYIN